MSDIICELYYLVEHQINQLDTQTEAEKELTDRWCALEGEIVRRLGEDGQEMMDALSNLNLELEGIHDQALFRAALRLGTEIARPDGAYSTSR